MNSYYIKRLRIKYKMEACFISKTVTQVISLPLNFSIFCFLCVKIILLVDPFLLHSNGDYVSSLFGVL